MKRLLLLLLLSISLLIAVTTESWINKIYATIEMIRLPIEITRFIGEPVEPYITLPIKSILITDIADTWQAPRPGKRTHDGQDIFAKRGTPIYSATEGYVMKVGANALGGNIVMIKGRGNRTYYYAHLHEHAKNITPGMFVTPQDVLGYVGDTGNAKGTPPHLHFGIYTSDGPINPLLVFEGRQRNDT